MGRPISDGRSLGIPGIEDSVLGMPGSEGRSLGMPGSDPPASIPAPSRTRHSGDGSCEEPTVPSRESDIPASGPAAPLANLRAEFRTPVYKSPPP